MSSGGLLKAEKELTVVEQRLQDAYVDLIDPKLACSLDNFFFNSFSYWTYYVEGR